MMGYSILEIIWVVFVHVAIIFNLIWGAYILWSIDVPAGYVPPPRSDDDYYA